MLMDNYFSDQKKVLDKIEKTQRESIIKAARAIADSISNDGMWHILDTGHMLMYEGVGRTGGMMAIRPVKINCTVDNKTRFRSMNGKAKVYYDTIDGFADYVLDQMNVKAGDVFVIGSVSGYNKLPVQLALLAKEMGVTTIGITSVEYSKRLVSAHKSGKRLFEAVDIVLDNCAEYGDAMVYVKSIDKKICPSTGIGASYIMWALQSTVVEFLIEKGLTPGIYISNHMPNATKLNGEAWDNYEKKGY